MQAGWIRALCQYCYEDRLQQQGGGTSSVVGAGCRVGQAVGAVITVGVSGALAFGYGATVSAASSASQAWKRMQQERERQEQSQTLGIPRPRALQELEQEQARRPFSEDARDVEIARLKEQVSRLRRQSSRFPQPPEEQDAQVEQRRVGVSRNRASVGSFETVQQDEGPYEASGLQEEGLEWS